MIGLLLSIAPVYAHVRLFVAKVIDEGACMHGEIHLIMPRCA